MEKHTARMMMYVFSYNLADFALPMPRIRIYRLGAASSIISGTYQMYKHHQSVHYTLLEYRPHSVLCLWRLIVAIESQNDVTHIIGMPASLRTITVCAPSKSSIVDETKILACGRSNEILWLSPFADSVPFTTRPYIRTQNKYSDGNVPPGFRRASIDRGSLNKVRTFRLPTYPFFFSFLSFLFEMWTLFSWDKRSGKLREEFMSGRYRL